MVNDALEQLAIRPFRDMLFERCASGSDQPSAMPDRVAFCGLQGPAIRLHLVLGFGDTGVQFDITMQIPYIRRVLEVGAEFLIRWESLCPLEGAPYCWVRETIVGELAINSGSRVSLSVDVSLNQRIQRNLIHVPAPYTSNRMTSLQHLDPETLLTKNM